MAEPRPYTKVVRAEREARTRTALLDGAQELFFSRPWDQITLKAVAQRAGVTEQTLLRHFGSKEGLLEQNLRRASEEVGAQRTDMPPKDIEAAIDNLLDHYEQRGVLALKLGAMDGVPLVAEFLTHGRQFHYNWVELAFGPWLDAAEERRRPHLRGALIALCDVQTWAILARDLGLPRSQVKATLVLAIRRLLGEGP